MTSVKLPESVASGTRPSKLVWLSLTNVGQMLSPTPAPGQVAGFIGPLVETTALTIKGDRESAALLAIAVLQLAVGESLFCTPRVEGSWSGSYERGAESTSASAYRSRELKFRESNPEILRRLVGRWVVLEGETIVAHGRDPLAVVAEAREKGVRVPYVFHVDEPRDDAAWIGL